MQCCGHTLGLSSLTLFLQYTRDMYTNITGNVYIQYLFLDSLQKTWLQLGCVGMQGEVLYRFARCKQPLTMRLMWNRGLPLPESQLDVLEPTLHWEQLRVCLPFHCTYCFPIVAFSGCTGSSSGAYCSH